MGRNPLILLLTVLVIIFVVPNHWIVTYPSEALDRVLLHKDYSKLKVDLIIFRGVDLTKKPFIFLSVLRNDNDHLFEKLEPLISNEEKRYIYDYLDSHFTLSESYKQRLTDGLKL